MTMKSEDTEKLLREELQAANDSIIEILESYMEVLEIFQKTMERDVISNRIKIMATSLCSARKLRWGNMLQELKDLRGE